MTKLAVEVEVGSGPLGTHASRDGRNLHTSITADDNVTVIDTETLELVGKVPAASSRSGSLTQQS